MSGLKIHTAWTTSAVATSTQKSFMRVDFSDDDTLIADLIKVAQNNVEAYTGRAITQQTLKLFLDRLPYYRDEKLREGVYTAPDLNYSANYIVLPKPPVASISHVKYYANDNTASTFASSNYFSDVDSTQARVVLKNGVSWPTLTELRQANAYEVQYVAGYGDSASDVPTPIIQAIKLLTTHLYENREMVTSMSANAIPYTVGQLLQPYRVTRLNNILGG